MRAKVLTAVLAGLLSVAVVSAYADHPQVNISLMTSAEQNCAQPGSCVSPSMVAVDPGSEIRWTNDGTVPLTIVGGDGADFINSGILHPGQTYALMFPDSGSYTFYVPSHPWMTGTVMVGGETGSHEGGTHMSGGHGAVEISEPIGLSVEAVADTSGGVTVNIMTQGWRWAPENVNADEIPGEGHAHIYADGVKINRAYGPYYYIEGLEPGSHHIRVVLYTSTHNELAINGFPIETTTIVVVPEYDAEPAATPEPVQGTDSMAVSAELHADALGGYNLQLKTTNFVLSGQSADQWDVQGIGYAVLSIDGQYKARLYDSWYKMSALDPGMHTITVSLYNSNHAPYYTNDQPIEASVTIEAP